QLTACLFRPVSSFDGHGPSSPCRVLGSRIEIVRVSPFPVQRSSPPATAEPFVGRPMRRTEDRRFVTGRGCYVDDFIRPDLTHAVLVRSAHAHARVSRIDATRARALPGVLAVLTSADLSSATAIPLRLAPLPGFDRYLQ